MRVTAVCDKETLSYISYTDMSQKKALLEIFHIIRKTYENIFNNQIAEFHKCIVNYNTARYIVYYNIQ